MWSFFCWLKAVFDNLWIWMAGRAQSTIILLNDPFWYSAVWGVIDKGSTKEVLFNRFLESHCFQDDIRNLCGTSWFLLSNELVKPISTSLTIPELPSKVQCSVSGTEMISQLEPLVSSSRLELVQLMGKSTHLFLREVLQTTGSTWFLTSQSQE